MNPAISIITPCYNQAAYLPETLTSVKNQTFQQWECIIVSDGSPDKVAEVAESFVNADGRFKFYDTKNGGPSVARNFGIAQAKGKYILPLDGDDLISKNYLEECFKIISSSENINVVYGAGEKFGAINEKWILKDYDFDELLFTNLIHPCGMFKKNQCEKIGGYDELMIDGIEDWEFWINLLKNGGIAKRTNNCTFYWRRKDESRTTRIDTYKNQKLQQHIYLKHFELYEKYFIDPIQLFKDFIYLKNFGDKVKEKPFSFFVRSLKNKIRK